MIRKTVVYVYGLLVCTYKGIELGLSEYSTDMTTDGMIDYFL